MEPWCRPGIMKPFPSHAHREVDGICVIFVHRQWDPPRRQRTQRRPPSNGARPRPPGDTTDPQVFATRSNAVSFDVHGRPLHLNRSLIPAQVLPCRRIDVDISMQVDQTLQQIYSPQVRPSPRAVHIDHTSHMTASYKFLAQLDEHGPCWLPRYVGHVVFNVGRWKPLIGVPIAAVRIHLPSGMCGSHPFLSIIG